MPGGDRERSIPISCEVLCFYVGVGWTGLRIGIARRVWIIVISRPAYIPSRAPSVANQHPVDRKIGLPPCFVDSVVEPIESGGGSTLQALCVLSLRKDVTGRIVTNKSSIVSIVLLFYKTKQDN